MNRILKCVRLYSVVLFLATIVCTTYDLYLLKISYNAPNSKVWEIDYDLYEHYLRFRGTSASILLCILTISLITANTTLIKILNKIKDSEQIANEFTGKKKQTQILKQMTIIFTISYGIRSIYAIFYGLYRNVIEDDFVRWMLQDSLDLVWDVPTILSMVYLNWSLLKDTEVRIRRASEHVRLYSSDGASSFYSSEIKT